MKTKEELIKYASDFKKAHGRLPKVIEVIKGMVVRNAEKTSNQRPWGSQTYANFSWIDYWCAFANSDGSGCIPEPVRKPSTCSADSSKRKNLDTNNTSEENSDHNEEIVGAHVIIECDPQKDLDDVGFIAPLCKKCNSKFNQIVNVQTGARLVEVIDHINDGDEKENYGDSERICSLKNHRKVKRIKEIMNYIEK